MPVYRVWNDTSGTELGRYHARSETEALDAMALDAAYDDYAALQDQVPTTGGVRVEAIAWPISFLADLDSPRGQLIWAGTGPLASRILAMDTDTVQEFANIIDEQMRMISNNSVLTLDPEVAAREVLDWIGES